MICLNIKVFLKEEDIKPQSILLYILQNYLQATFPNIFIVTRILLTLSISVATGQRSFSKLKIFKNYLRSTMLQERLSNISIISIEHEILDNLDIHDLISKFALHKARKVSFL